MKSLLKNQKGVSLVEVLVGILILSVGLMALSKLQTVIVTNNNWSQQRINALLLAQAYLDETILTDYANLSSLHNKQYTKPSGKYVYKVKTMVYSSRPVIPLPANTRRVTAEVTWGKHNIILETIRSNTGN